MQSRRLGKSGLEVSEIGIGCWQLGGDFGAMDDDRASATLAAATAAGVTFFDTADVYGGGESENRIGRYMAKSGERPVVATKVGRSADLYPDGYDADAISDHLKASADRLGVNSLDLVQLHCVPPAELQAGVLFDTMNRMVSEGLCRHWGASVETLEEAKLCLRQDQLTSLQIIFNLFRQDASWDLFDQAIAADVGIIVRLPLASGLLTGKFRADTQFEEQDHRNYNRDGAAFSVGETFSGIPLAKGVDLVEGLKPHVPKGWSLADLSLRWILDHPAVTTIIAGCSRPEQVAGNARASSLQVLPGSAHEALKAYYLDQVRSTIRCPI